MTSLKDDMEERETEKRDKKIAAALGITYDELAETDFYIDSEGHDAFFLIVFEQSSPHPVLDKIKGLEGGNTVRLDPSIFND